MRGRRLFYGVLAAVSACILAGASLTASAGESRWDSSTSRDENNNIRIDFEEIQVTLPASWSGKCQMGTGTDSVSFYQTKSRELYTRELGYPNGGWLFSINWTQNTDYLADDPNYMTLGPGYDGIYYASFPTDFQGYANDADACSEFQSMSGDIEWIKANMKITFDGESIFVMDNDYILPLSSSAYLSESELSGMSADEIQMAINEIYARHHRKFVIQSIQDYFNSKSWYSGTVEAADFDVSVMNTYEGANINLMVEYLNNMAASDQNITVLPASTKDAYGMIIESGSGYFKVRQADGSVIQFWYDTAKLDSMGLAADDLEAGATVSLIYDTDSYEAVSILIF